MSNLIAHWKMDGLDYPATCTLTPSGQTAITGTKAGQYNGKDYYTFTLSNWLVANANAAGITYATAGVFAENVYYDTASSTYYLMAYIGGYNYFYTASSMTGSWTGPSAAISDGTSPVLKKFGDTYYIYATTGADWHIACYASSTITGTYVLQGTVLERSATNGDWDYGRVDEVDVFEYNGGYGMLYMAGQTRADLGGSTEYEKTGYAWSATPTGTFTKSASNPVLSGDSGTWDAGYDKAADPYEFEIDGVKYVGVTAAASGKSQWTISYFKVTDFTQSSGYSLVSTTNPLFNKGASGQWDDYALIKGGAILSNNQWYLSYTATAALGANAQGGIATLTTASKLYCWWDGTDTWVISDTLGTKKDADWTLTAASPFGSYTSAIRIGATLAASTVPDDVGSYNATYYKGASVDNTSNGAVAGKISGGLDFDTTTSGEYVSYSGSISGIKSIAFWLKPDSIAVANQGLVYLSLTNYLKLSNATITKVGFSTGTATIYVDGKVSSTLPDTDWHHIVLAVTSAYSTTALWLGKYGSTYLNAVLDDVRFYSNTLSADEVNKLYISNDTNSARGRRDTIRYRF